VDIQFPKRKAAIYHLELSEAEWTLYRAVTEYIRRRFQDGDSSKHLRLTLVILQKELSSSPQALAATLRKMVDDRAHGTAVRAELQRFLELAEAIPLSRKMLAVRELVNRFPGQFLIFTEYRETQAMLERQLRAWGVSTVGFHGGLDIGQKERAVTAFRDGAVRVMVSTESGAEGRNLQFCHQLINYDLPWNPMRVEQRIGRLHRLGQANDVTIFNLSCNETIESHVIDLLARKIRMFELVIGELDMILGNIDGNKSFEDLFREAWETSTSDDDFAGRMQALGDLLAQARRDYERVRANNELLDRELEQG
jgi:SNF2 family DNA or RNA helicase